MGRGFATAAGLAVFVAAGPGLAEDLPGSEWAPAEIGGDGVDDDFGAFVQFGGEGRVSGSGGCNRFTGDYRSDPAGAVAIGPLAMTRMACPEPRMALETRLMAALEAAAGFVRDGAALILSDAAGEPVARFRQTDWD